MSNERERAHRVFKRVKAGMYEYLSELDHEEIGLLYRYYPWALPHEESGRSSICSTCGKVSANPRNSAGSGADGGESP